QNPKTPKPQNPKGTGIRQNAFAKSCSAQIIKMRTGSSGRAAVATTATLFQSRIQLKEERVLWTILDRFSQITAWLYQSVSCRTRSLTILPLLAFLCCEYFTGSILRTDPLPLLIKLLGTATILLESTATIQLSKYIKGLLLYCAQAILFACLISSLILPFVIFKYSASLPPQPGKIRFLVLYTISFSCWHVGFVLSLLAISLLGCIPELFVRLLICRLRMPICTRMVPRLSRFGMKLVLPPDVHNITETMCLICMERFEESESTATLDTCAHVFHRKCLVREASASTYEAWRCETVCPVCRNSP
ncbi:MAG: RING finger domain-containing protein, partial [Anaerolineaceae bacterium]|nr:RING finger domain-containing protein [Anaerolineaceae bacterium]